VKFNQKLGSVYEYKEDEEDDMFEYKYNPDGLYLDNDDEIDEIDEIDKKLKQYGKSVLSFIVRRFVK